MVNELLSNSQRLLGVDLRDEQPMPHGERYYKKRLKKSRRNLRYLQKYGSSTSTGVDIGIIGSHLDRIYFI